MVFTHVLSSCRCVWRHVLCPRSVKHSQAFCADIDVHNAFPFVLVKVNSLRFAGLDAQPLRWNFHVPVVHESPPPEASETVFHSFLKLDTKVVYDLKKGRTSSMKRGKSRKIGSYLVVCFSQISLKHFANWLLCQIF